MGRYDNLKCIEQLDPQKDHIAIYQLTTCYDISNDDYLYVLSVFIYEPVHWLERLGWRKMSEKEKLASYYFWCEIGRRMNIGNTPESYAAFEQFSINYEREHFCYAESNHRVGEATRDLFLSWFPAPQFVRNLLKPCIYALLDDAMLDAFGFPHPPGWLRQSLTIVLKARAYALRFFPPRKKPFMYNRDVKHRSYPHGFSLADLGPYSMLPMLNRTQSPG